MSENKFVLTIVHQLESEIKQKLGDQIIDAYLESVRAELVPAVKELINDVNIKDFALMKNLMTMRDDLNIVIEVKETESCN